MIVSSALLYASSLYQAEAAESDSSYQFNLSSPFLLSGSGDDRVWLL